MRTLRAAVVSCCPEYEESTRVAQSTVESNAFDDRDDTESRVLCPASTRSRPVGIIAAIPPRCCLPSFTELWECFVPRPLPRGFSECSPLNRMSPNRTPSNPRCSSLQIYSRFEDSRQALRTVEGLSCHQCARHKRRACYAPTLEAFIYSVNGFAPERRLNRASFPK